MDRRLIIMRHAKSCWDDPTLRDHQRPLNKRGRRQAPLVAGRLVELDWIPELVISSDAERTRQTWQYIRDVFDEPVDVRFVSALYHGSVDEFLPAVSDAADEIETVLVLGHNPGFEEIVEWLCGEDITMTTSNAVLLTGEGQTWEKALRRQTWTFQDVIRPRELED